MASLRSSVWFLIALVVLGALPFVFGSYGLYLGSALCVWMMFALAYDLAFGRTGLLSFGHAMFFGVGAYIPVLAVIHLGWGFWPAIASALAGAGIFAVLVGAIALQVSGHAFVVITVIFGAIVELVAFSQKKITNGEDGLSFDLPRVPLPFGVLDLSNGWSKYGLMLAFLAVVFAVIAALNASTFGLACRAIRENPRRATLLGYPVGRYKLAAFSISGALSGLAGALFGFLNFHVSAEVFQISTSINPLTSVLIGGAGTTLGPVIGTAFIFILSDYLRSLVVYADFAIGVILVGTVLFAPQGIVGVAERLWSRRAARAAPIERESTVSRDAALPEART